MPLLMHSIVVLKLPARKHRATSLHGSHVVIDEDCEGAPQHPDGKFRWLGTGHLLQRLLLTLKSVHVKDSERQRQATHTLTAVTRHTFCPSTEAA